MKLYTEEQVLIMIRKARVHKMDDSEMFSDEYILGVEAAIELPSDEEIHQELGKLPYTKHLDDGLFNDGQLAGFELGAKWAIEQIKQQSNGN